MASSRANTQEPIYNQSFTELPYLTNCAYSIQREKNAVETIKELLQTKDFYEPISVNKCFLIARHLCYTFVKKLKENGISIKNTILFVQHYAGAKGNVYFIWKKESISDSKVSEKSSKIFFKRVQTKNENPYRRPHA